ncbi:hypothetical protein EDB83DRAFT_2346040 [Lactarius deliciosus]|nr:hypothetical protein EDB83DRAFT_2346040 [Lactarius deliciosus]
MLLVVHCHRSVGVVHVVACSVTVAVSTECCRRASDATRMSARTWRCRWTSHLRWELLLEEPCRVPPCTLPWNLKSLMSIRNVFMVYRQSISYRATVACSQSSLRLRLLDGRRCCYACAVLAPLLPRMSPRDW